MQSTSIQGTPPRFISCDSSTASSITSPGGKLPIFVLKQFAIDIESAPGGPNRLGRFGLGFEIFLDEQNKKGRDYGKKNSFLRKKLYKILAR